MAYLTASAGVAPSAVVDDTGVLTQGPLMDAVHYSPLVFAAAVEPTDVTLYWDGERINAGNVPPGERYLALVPQLIVGEEFFMVGE